MRRRFFLGIALSVVLSAGVMPACSGSAAEPNEASSTGGAAGSPGIDGGNDAAKCVLDAKDKDILERMADAICVPAVDCCGEAGMKFDVPACRTAFLAIVEPQIERSRCDGHEWDPPALDECIAVTKEANEMCLPSLLLPHALSDRMEQACGKIAKGELENPGAACESNLGCHAGEGKLAYCVDDLTIPGGPVCRLTTVVDEGEPCAPPDVVCKLGLACDGTCRPVASVGEACIEAVCDNGTWCVGGICALPKVSGEPCENNTECQYWCGATGVCGGGPGDACSTVADCFGTDCLGGKCAGQLGDAAWFSACEL